jgi:hypothetical protein
MMKTKGRHSHRIAAFAVAALAGATSIGLLAPSASAQTDSGNTDSSTQARPAHPMLTDEQKACLEKNGVTPPAKPADGQPRTEPTDAEKAKHKAAFEACNIPLPQHRPGGPGGPGGPGHPKLTDAQKQCLEDNGVTKPAKPADGEKPAKPTDEQRAKFEAAAKKCNIELPAHPDNDNNQSGASTDNSESSTPTTQGSSTTT